MNSIKLPTGQTTPFLTIVFAGIGTRASRLRESGIGAVDACAYRVLIGYSGSHATAYRIKEKLRQSVRAEFAEEGRGNYCFAKAPAIIVTQP